MIHARLTEARDYLGIHPRLDRALALLTPDFLESVGHERLELEGDRLYVTRFDYRTVPPEESFFEAHRRYLDIHVLLCGEEGVELAHPSTLTEFTHEGDFWGYRGEGEQRILLRPGHFLVVFPGDAHRLKLMQGTPQEVSKTVFKILFNE